VAIREDSAVWPLEQPRWFRGEPESDQPLLPTLYRKGLGARENPLLQTFRVRAAGYSDTVPARGDTDQWLFLARHAGLPTRLLDWSEGALIGLHFALKEECPILWMLNPLQLNFAARGKPTDGGADTEREFPLTWFSPPHPKINEAFENISGAWVHDRRGVEMPVAIHPNYVHARLRGQSACFTVHGKRKEGLHVIAPKGVLRRYQIDPSCRASMIKELRILGITESVAFPDLDGLARELTERFS
jgi:hypothetical protein